MVAAGRARAGMAATRRTGRAEGARTEMATAARVGGARTGMATAPRAGKAGRAVTKRQVKLKESSTFKKLFKF